MALFFSFLFFKNTRASFFLQLKWWSKLNPNEKGKRKKKEWSKQNQMALEREVLSSELSEMRTLKSLLKQLMILPRVTVRLQVGISIYQGRQAKLFSPFFQVWEANMIAISIAVLQVKAN